MAQARSAPTQASAISGDGLTLVIDSDAGDRPGIAGACIEFTLYSYAGFVGPSNPIPYTWFNPPTGITFVGPNIMKGGQAIGYYFVLNDNFLAGKPETGISFYEAIMGFSTFGANLICTSIPHPANSFTPGTWKVTVLGANQPLTGSSKKIP